MSTAFVGEVCGRLKQGAAYGYSGLLGYHPILATRADTREALHIRLRKGSANTQKGIERFTDELIARVDRAGATGVKLLRADSASRVRSSICPRARCCASSSTSPPGGAASAGM